MNIRKATIKNTEGMVYIAQNSRQTQHIWPVGADGHYRSVPSILGFLIFIAMLSFAAIQWNKLFQRMKIIFEGNHFFANRFYRIFNGLVINEWANFFYHIIQ